MYSLTLKEEEECIVENDEQLQLKDILRTKQFW